MVILESLKEIRKELRLKNHPHKRRETGSAEAEDHTIMGRINKVFATLQDSAKQVTFKEASKENILQIQVQWLRPYFYEARLKCDKCTSVALQAFGCAPYLGRLSRMISKTFKPRKTYQFSALEALLSATVLT